MQLPFPVKKDCMQTSRKKYLFIFFCLNIFFANAQVGIGTTTPTSFLDIQGSIAAATRSFTTGSTASFSDETLFFTGTSAAALTLPDASTCQGRFYWVKNASTTSPVPVLTINTVSSQTIDGLTSWLLDEPYEVVRLVSNGTNWSAFIENTPVAKSATNGGGWLEGGNKLRSLKNIGTITNYDFPFVNANTEMARLTGGGFLGVGSSSPSGHLHFISQNDDAGNDYIFSDYSVTVTQGFFVRRNRGTVASPADLQQGDLISQFRFAPRYNGALPHNDGSGVDAYYTGNGTTNSSDLRFFSSGTETMHISENGKAGIGTSSFDATNPEKLKVFAGTTTSYNVISGRGSYDNYLQLNILNQSNTANASSDVVATAANGSETAYYLDMGINSGNYSNTALPILKGSNTAYLYALGNDFVMGNSTGGQSLIFFNAGYAPSNEAIRVLSSGNVGLGVIAPADKLSVAGRIVPNVDNTYSAGTSSKRWTAVYAVNGTIQTSDLRLKTNVQNLGYGLNVLNKIKTISWYWKNSPGGNRKIGLIAQQLQSLIPEVVTVSKKGPMGLNYAELIPVLVNSLKQQQEMLNNLKKELTGLEEQLN